MNAYSQKLRHDGFAENAEVIVSVETASHGSCFTVKCTGSSDTGAWGTSKPGLPPLESFTFAVEDDATEYAKGVVEAYIPRFGFRECA
jgi:hypothetical protein